MPETPVQAYVRQLFANITLNFEKAYEEAKKIALKMEEQNADGSLSVDKIYPHLQQILYISLMVKPLPTMQLDWFNDRQAMLEAIKLKLPKMDDEKKTAMAKALMTALQQVYIEQQPTYSNEIRQFMATIAYELRSTTLSTSNSQVDIDTVREMMQRAGFSSSEIDKMNQSEQIRDAASLISASEKMHEAINNQITATKSQLYCLDPMDPKDNLIVEKKEAEISVLSDLSSKLSDDINHFYILANPLLRYHQAKITLQNTLQTPDFPLELRIQARELLAAVEEITKTTHLPLYELTNILKRANKVIKLTAENKERIPEYLYNVTKTLLETILQTSNVPEILKQQTEFIYKQIELLKTLPHAPFDKLAETLILVIKTILHPTNSQEQKSSQLLYYLDRARLQTTLQTPGLNSALTKVGETVLLAMDKLIDVPNVLLTTLILANTDIQNRDIDSLSIYCDPIYPYQLIIQALKTTLKKPGLSNDLKQQGTAILTAVENLKMNSNMPLDKLTDALKEANKSIYYSSNKSTETLSQISSLLECYQDLTALQKTLKQYQEDGLDVQLISKIIVELTTLPSGSFVKIAKALEKANKSITHSTCKNDRIDILGNLFRILCRLSDEPQSQLEYDQAKAELQKTLINPELISSSLHNHGQSVLRTMDDLRHNAPNVDVRKLTDTLQMAKTTIDNRNEQFTIDDILLLSSLYSPYTQYDRLKEALATTIDLNLPLQQQGRAILAIIEQLKEGSNGPRFDFLTQSLKIANRAMTSIDEQTVSQLLSRLHYHQARIELITTLQTKHVEPQFYQLAQRLSIETGDMEGKANVSFDDLTNALRTTKEVLANPSRDNLQKCANEGLNFTEHSVMRKIGAIMLGLVGLALIGLSIAAAINTGGLSLPFSTPVIQTGLLLIAGAGVTAAYGSYSLWNNPLKSELKGYLFSKKTAPETPEPANPSEQQAQDKYKYK